MANNYGNDPMIEIYVFETLQFVENIEQMVLTNEKSRDFESSIDEIFRAMHSIKGSSAMMLFNNIASVAHALEDLFDYLKKQKPQNINVETITDLVLSVLDFVKNEVVKVQNGSNPDADEAQLVKEVKQYLNILIGDKSQIQIIDEGEKISENKSKYYISSKAEAANSNAVSYTALIFFEDDCDMESLRAFTALYQLKEKVGEVQTYPEDLIDNDNSTEIIKTQGFQMIFETDINEEEMKKYILDMPFIKEFHISINEKENNLIEKTKKQIILDQAEIEIPTLPESNAGRVNSEQTNSKDSLINVNVAKLDLLMDMVGELVITEAMVTQNPELAGLNLDNFHKSARQLRKITSELQDMVMSIRLVPIAATFQKMNRVVRDMSKKLNKDVELELVGEEIEVDKNIIEHISDPLMHLIRNSMDHGLESSEERIEKGKPKKGRIILEAKNSGGDVWLMIKDDGRGLNKEKILQKAEEKGLLNKPANELTDREIYSFVFLPGFSTNEGVTEYSGRGVGMDVAMKNIEKIRGIISVDSATDKGTTISIKIPLTLAIIDGMNIKVGEARYTVPTTCVKESFKASENDIIRDPEGNEMVLIRGECCPVLRLQSLYKVNNAVDKIDNGIMMMVEGESKVICLFADALIGQQQVVVKALPKYIKRVKGVDGCTLLGDGSISLILDITDIAL
jgi:two-component system chemotaxis sensor kinase CheA